MPEIERSQNSASARHPFRPRASRKSCVNTRTISAPYSWRNGAGKHQSSVSKMQTGNMA
jgi:hypothetical protein